MSVKHKRDSIAGGGNTGSGSGGNVEELAKEVQSVKAAGESAAVLLAISFKAQIVQDRAAGTNVISDEMILASAAVVDYPEFEDNHAYNTVGEIIKYDGLYFEIVAAHTSNAAAFPVKTTFAYYRLVELAHAGTLADPIPYPEEAGIVVNVKNGLYYSYAVRCFQSANRLVVDGKAGRFTVAALGGVWKG